MQRECRRSQRSRTLTCEGAKTPPLSLQRSKDESRDHSDRGDTGSHEGCLLAKPYSEKIKHYDTENLRHIPLESCKKKYIKHYK